MLGGHVMTIAHKQRVTPKFMHIMTTISGAYYASQIRIQSHVWPRFLMINSSSRFLNSTDPVHFQYISIIIIYYQWQSVQVASCKVIPYKQDVLADL